MKKILLILIPVILAASGCVSIRHAVPAGLSNQVYIPGFQDIRAFSGRSSGCFKEDLIDLLEQDQDKGCFPGAGRPNVYSMLALSGGSANGAYGAGLLKGWSASGLRPDFKIVTGISTGAIMAPFAFLGSEYDDRLEQLYTRYSAKDIIGRKGLFQGLFGDSFASSFPLERLIAGYFNHEILKQISDEHNKGRRLYVGTTNLDAQRLVIWDMGRIARGGDEKALRLFRKIILASASMPVLFPPVYIGVEAGNSVFDEMHVDGGVTKQVFFLYDVIQGLENAVKEKGIRRSAIKYEIYIIRNGYADAVWQEVPGRLVSIAERTVDTMTQAHAAGDICQLYFFTSKYGGDFNLAYIPEDYKPKAKGLFEPSEMQNLFDTAYKKALKGYPWKKAPPGFERI
ncbi:MAG: patatin-like phospholipase family protein [Candidatus Omnitrophota bacterium]